MSQITVKGIKCPVCLDELWSKYRHDFHYCTCSYVFVDGGRDYLRFGWGVEGDTSAGMPEAIDITVTLETVEAYNVIQEQRDRVETYSSWLNFIPRKQPTRRAVRAGKK